MLRKRRDAMYRFRCDDEPQMRLPLSGADRSTEQQPRCCWRCGGRADLVGLHNASGACEEGSGGQRCAQQTWSLPEVMHVSLEPQQSLPHRLAVGPA